MAALSPVHTAERDTDPPSPTPPTGPSDEAFLSESRQLLDRACVGNHRGRGEASLMIDELLDRARRAFHGGALSPPYYARVLRASALVRNMAQLPNLPPDPIVQALISHTVRYGLAAHNAAAQSLRGTLAVSRGSVDEALDAVVDSLVTLELLDEHSVERALALNDTASLLDRLGIPDLAADVFGEAATEFGAVGLVRYQFGTLGDQVRTELLFGMWLERVGQIAAGAHRFAHAAQLAEEAIRMSEKLDGGLPSSPADLADFHAAFAFADPDPEHEPTLRAATATIAVPGHMVASIALVRLLAASRRHTEADLTLTRLRTECQRFQLGLPMRLALARSAHDLSGSGAPAGVRGYITELENEMWAVHEARSRSLRGRLELERLRRGGGAMRERTAQDPVTRLPDRTVIDRMLRTAPDPADLPLAMAMIDVDQLVRINDNGSYADGDAALRAIAATARGLTGPDDTVLRYSDDEFVVMMPNRTLDDAVATMREVVTAVTGLSFDRAHGATVSIGVVTIGPDEVGDSSLVRAEDATAQAKARGGNQVSSLPGTPSPH